LDNVTINRYNSLINISGGQLVNIINDIIDISKIELNQIVINKTDFDVYSCLKNIVDIQQNNINQLSKDIKIIYSVPDDLAEIVINSDEMRFKQIVYNLLSNASKYTDEGIIEVGYSIKTRHEEEVIEFFVKDTGLGIPEEAFDVIFDRFIQAKNIDFQKGTGLGLSITKGLLNLLGGEIWLKSELNKGSEFFFTLPYHEIQPGQKSKPMDEKPADSYDLSDKLVYIAEDDSRSYYFLEQILKPSGIKIKQAENGKQLLDFIKVKIPDLVLLDINMPIMDGYEAIVEIRKILPDLPVIAQTAYALSEERQRCLDSGCNGYISKPINSGELLKLMKPYLVKD